MVNKKERERELLINLLVSVYLEASGDQLIFFELKTQYHSHDSESINVIIKDLWSFIEKLIFASIYEMRKYNTKQKIKGEVSS